MAWDDFPKFFGTTKRRGLGRIMVDAVDGAEGFKTKVMMVNGEKMTLRTRGGFPRIYGELTAMPVTPDPVSFGVLQLFMVPPGEIGSSATGSNGYYRLSTGEYALRPYLSDATDLTFHESATADAATVEPVNERQLGNLDWFNKANSADANNPAVTWGFRSGGRHGHVPSIFSSRWPTYSVYPSGQGIYVDGVMIEGSDKFTVLGAGMNAAGKVVAVLTLADMEPSRLSMTTGSTTLISVVQDAAGSLDLSLGAPIPGWSEVCRKVLTPQYAFYQPVFLNASGTHGCTIARQKDADPAVVTMDLASLTFTSVPNWKWRTFDSAFIAPSYTTLSVPAGPTLNAGYEFADRAAHHVDELEQVIAVDYDGDALVKLTRFSRLDRYSNWTSPMTTKVVQPTFYSLPITDALDENKAIIAAIVWPSGLTLSSGAIEAAAKSALSTGKVSFNGDPPDGWWTGVTVRTYGNTSTGMTSSDVSVSLIDPAFTTARTGSGRLENLQYSTTVGTRTYGWLDETTSYGMRVNADADVFLSSVVRSGKGSEFSSYADAYVSGMRLQKFSTSINGPGTRESANVDLNYVVVELSTPPAGTGANYYSTETSTLVTNTLHACDLRHRAFLIKQDDGSTKAFFSSITLSTPPVTLGEQLSSTGIDPGFAPDAATDLGETVSQMTVHQGGTNLVYTDTINDQHTAHHCSVTSPSPTPISPPVAGALFVAPIYFRKSPIEE